MQSEANGSNKESTQGSRLRIWKANFKKNEKGKKRTETTTVACRHYHHKQGYNYQVHNVFSKIFLWRKTAFWVTPVFFSLAELLWMKLKFQQFYLEKHSAYYTAQFPILSQVRTQTHTHTHTQNTKWGRSTKQSPRQAQWYKNTQTKRKDGYYVRFERDSSNYSYTAL